jgi:hypothetical protein
MAATLAELEQRLAALEQEVAALRHRLQGWPGGETAAERGARQLHEATSSQAHLAPGWARALEQMGICGEPIGAERVQELMAACGIQAEDNELSRGLIDMREE